MEVVMEVEGEEVLLAVGALVVETLEVGEVVEVAGEEEEEELLEVEVQDQEEEEEPTLRVVSAVAVVVVVGKVMWSAVGVERR